MADKTTAPVRFGITLKLTLASSALVLTLSAAFIASDVVSTQNQYQVFAERLAEGELGALRVRGLTTANNVASSVFSLLLNGDAAGVADLISSVAKTDPELHRVVVVRPGGRIVGATAGLEIGAAFDGDITKKLKTLEETKIIDDVSLEDLKETISFGGPIAISVGDGIRREGMIYLEMSTTLIAEQLEAIEADRRSALRDALITTVALGVLALLAGIAFAALQGVRFGNSIRALVHVAQEVGSGNLEAEAKKTSNDELGVLAVRFNEMTNRLKTLLKESAAKAALDQELERATAIQRLLLPEQEDTNVAAVACSGFCDPASSVGGDWWHYYQLDEDRVLICVGDVTGHGIPSAMLTASAKACCDTYLFDRKSPDVGRFLQVLDHTIQEAGKGELVMTFFVTLLDRKAKKVTYANAGHNFPFLIRGKKLSHLVARGARLGDGKEYESKEMEIAPGDRLILYTDGVVECTNTEGEEYGMRRLRRLLKKSGSTMNAVELRDEIIGKSYDFFGSQPREDDVTVVVCEIGW